MHSCCDQIWAYILLRLWEIVVQAGLEHGIYVVITIDGALCQIEITREDQTLSISQN
jgi:uncharacterized protein YuzE